MYRSQQNVPSSEPQTSEQTKPSGFFQATNSTVSRSERVYTPETAPEQAQTDTPRVRSSSKPAYLRRAAEGRRNPATQAAAGSQQAAGENPSASPEAAPSAQEEAAPKPKKNPFSELESAMRGQSLNELTNFRNALGRLETIIRQGKRFPMSSMISVDSSQLFNLFEDLNKAVPSVIEQASAVLAQRSEMLTTAKKVSDEAIQSAKQLKAETEKMVERKKQEAEALLQQQATEVSQRAAYQADEIIRQARQQGQMIVDSAEQKALRMLDEQEILARANMEAEELKRQAQETIDTVYSNVYSQLDTMLDIIDRSYSQQLNDIRIMRQQINQNMK